MIAAALSAGAIGHAFAGVLGVAPEPSCGREKGLGRRADVRRAMVPENGEPAVRVIRARVVHMQRATVAQLQSGLCHHPPSLKALAGTGAPTISSRGEIFTVPLSRDRRLTPHPG